MAKEVTRDVLLEIYEEMNIRYKRKSYKIDDDIEIECDLLVDYNIIINLRYEPDLRPFMQFDSYDDYLYYNECLHDFRHYCKDNNFYYIELRNDMVRTEVNRIISKYVRQRIYNNNDIRVDYVNVDDCIGHSKYLDQKMISDKVYEFFEILGINKYYHTEVEFPGLRSRYANFYRFDLYFEDYNLLVELDDPSHYVRKRKSTKSEMRVDSDKRKSDYCREQNINLIRIPYWMCQKDMIKEIDQFTDNLISKKINELNSKLDANIF